jgi:hypothetical protein
MTDKVLGHVAASLGSWKIEACIKLVVYAFVVTMH